MLRVRVRLPYKFFYSDREVEEERSPGREKQTQVPQPARQRLPSSVNPAQTSNQLDDLSLCNFFVTLVLKLDRQEQAKLVYKSILKDEPTHRVALANLQLMELREAERAVAATRRAEREKEARLKKAMVSDGSTV